MCINMEHLVSLLSAFLKSAFYRIVVEMFTLFQRGSKDQCYQDKYLNSPKGSLALLTTMHLLRSEKKSITLNSQI